jgi:TPR repeat protein
LANNYYFGDGVKQNKMKAKQLYKKACEQGNKDSCQNLKKFNFTN